MTDSEEDSAYLHIPWPRPPVEHQVVEKSKRLTIYRILAEANDATPIGRLPDTVLHRIFQFHVAGFPFCFPRGRTRSSHNWVAISLVCFRWRKLALESPDLWTSIVFPSRPDAVEAALLRSGRHPLSIVLMLADTVDRMDKPLEDAARRILANMHRVQSLILVHWPPALQKCVDSLPARANQLRFFSAKSLGAVPFLLQHNDMRGLQHIELQVAPVAFWAHCHSWPCLRQLVLSTIDPQTDLDDILRGLQWLRDLQVLILSCTFAAGKPAETYIAASLYKSSYVRLVNNFDNAAHLLTYLRFSPFTRLVVTYNEPHLRLQSLAASTEHYQFVLWTLITNSARPLVSVELKYDKGGSGSFFTFSGWTSDQCTGPKELRWKDTAPSFKFSVRLPALVSSIQALLAYLPLMNVQAVRLRNINFADEFFLGDLVGLLRNGCLRNIRALDVKDGFLGWLDSVLWFDPNINHCPLRNLQTLKLQHTSKKGGCMNKVLSTTCVGCIHIWLYSLQARKHVGMPIRNLRLKDPRYKHDAQQDIDSLFEATVP